MANHRAYFWGSIKRQILMIQLSCVRDATNIRRLEAVRRKKASCYTQLYWGRFNLLNKAIQDCPSSPTSQALNYPLLLKASPVTWQGKEQDFVLSISPPSLLRPPSLVRGWQPAASSKSRFALGTKWKHFLVYHELLTFFLNIKTPLPKKIPIPSRLLK